ncbi:MAG: MFS transporter [Acidimicrobiia bacterium]|nr:MFS transporter [Acidimicrobiia bacterium]
MRQRSTPWATGAWVLYDLANTVFALGVSGLYFASWVKEEGAPDSALAIATASAMVVVIITSPWIGARSDHAGRRIRYLWPMTALAVVPTFFLASVDLIPSLALFAVALVGFNLGGVVYDALLPTVSTPANRGLVSGLGVGFGYVGSFIAVAVGALLLDQGYDRVFQGIAVMFAVLAIPTFFLIREPARPPAPGPPPRLADAGRQLIASWRATSMYTGLRRFLIGRFLYTDAVNTLIGGFLTIFAKEELGFTETQLEQLLAVAIAFAIVGGLGAGPLVDKFGPRKVLHGVLWMWMIAMTLGILAAALDAIGLAWALGGLGGMALGGLWASDRVYMARIAPPHRLGEFYGLYATVGRFATVLGPLLWALIVDGLGFSRTVALGALALFVAAGRVVLAGVDDQPRQWPQSSDASTA